ncbi:hypothetical protein C8R45DRAFT_945366 [Mycena sanguinolenta]|nr:hypothetical protein C8R45DRAFT_945366 [Mycena sanguinolenta]
MLPRESTVPWAAPGTDLSFYGVSFPFLARRPVMARARLLTDSGVPSENERDSEDTFGDATPTLGMQIPAAARLKLPHDHARQTRWPEVSCEICTPNGCGHAVLRGPRGGVLASIGARGGLRYRANAEQDGENGPAAGCARTTGLGFDDLGTGKGPGYSLDTIRAQRSTRVGAGALFGGIGGISAAVPRSTTVRGNSHSNRSYSPRSAAAAASVAGGGAGSTAGAGSTGEHGCGQCWGPEERQERSLHRPDPLPISYYAPALTREAELLEAVSAICVRRFVPPFRHTAPKRAHRFLVWLQFGRRSSTHLFSSARSISAVDTALLVPSFYSNTSCGELDTLDHHENLDAGIACIRDTRVGATIGRLQSPRRANHSLMKTISIPPARSSLLLHRRPSFPPAGISIVSSTLRTPRLPRRRAFAVDLRLRAKETKPALTPRLRTQKRNTARPASWRCDGRIASTGGVAGYGYGAQQKSESRARLEGERRSRAGMGWLDRRGFLCSKTGRRGKSGGRGRKGKGKGLRAEKVKRKEGDGMDARAQEDDMDGHGVAGGGRSTGATRPLPCWRRFIPRARLPIHDRTGIFLSPRVPCMARVVCRLSHRIMAIFAIRPFHAVLMRGLASTGDDNDAVTKRGWVGCTSFTSRCCVLVGRRGLSREHGEEPTQRRGSKHGVGVKGGGIGGRERGDEEERAGERREVMGRRGPANGGLDDFA